MNKKVAKIFWMALTVYIVSGICLLTYYHYRYQINPDAISYISIARKYLRGDFANAVNGCWSPLFSWLLMPFLALGLPPLIAAKTLLLIIGAFTLMGVDRLSGRFELSASTRRAVLLASVPVVLSFALILITPDLLLVCLLINYFCIIFDREYPDGPRQGVLCGAICGVAYLAKAYALPFFLAHFFLLNAIHYLKHQREAAKKAVLQSFFAGAAVFLVISGPWIVAISSKYKVVTVSTAAAYNAALSSPGSQGHPAKYKGFLPPPNDTAVSIGEDPSFLKSKPWSPFQSLDSFTYKVKFILNNIKKAFSTYQALSPISAVIFLAAIMYCLKIFKNKGLLSDILFYALLTIFLYTGGYAMILLKERYLWICYILLIMMGGYLLDILFRHKVFTPAGKNLALSLFAVLVFLMPAKKIIKRKRIPANKQVFEFGEILKKEYNLNGNVASHNEWRRTFYLLFYLKGRYYGKPKKDISPRELERDLLKYNIKHYLVWGEPEKEFDFLTKYKKHSLEKIPGLRIYSLAE